MINTKLQPILTEKSLEKAEKGKYSFWVNRTLSKYKIKQLISKTFDVEVDDVRTMNYKPTQKRDFRGKDRRIKGGKKAIVTLKGKDKLDLFESSK